MDSATGAVSGQKKKKKNLLTSLFHRNKSKHKSKEKDKVQSSAVAKQSQYVNNSVISSEENHAKAQQGMVPLSSIQDQNDCWIQTRSVSKSSAVDQPSPLTSANLEPSPGNVRVTVSSTTDAQLRVVHSRSSSHSSGFDEISSSMTECSCNTEQSRSASALRPPTPASDTIASSVIGKDCDTNSLDTVLPSDVADDVISDATVDVDEIRNATELTESDVIPNVVEETQTDDDVKVVCSSNEESNAISTVTTASSDITSSNAACETSASAILITASSETLEKLEKLREVKNRLYAARPSSTIHVSSTTTATHPVSKTQMPTLNSNYRNLLASGMTRAFSTSSEHIPLKQMASKWRQPSLPVVAKTTVGISVNTPTFRTPPAKTPQRNVRRSRESSNNTFSKPVFYNTQLSHSDTVSSTSSGQASHHEVDEADVMTYASIHDVNNSSLADDFSQQRRYSSAMDLSESGNDVIRTAKAKKAALRRLDVRPESARYISANGIDMQQDTNHIANSIDMIDIAQENNQQDFSQDQLQNAFQGDSVRRLRSSVSYDATRRMPSKHRSMSDRFVDLEQSFSHWHQQLSSSVTCLSSYPLQVTGSQYEQNSIRETSPSQLGRLHTTGVNDSSPAWNSGAAPSLMMQYETS